VNELAQWQLCSDDTSKKKLAKAHLNAQGTRRDALWAGMLHFVAWKQSSQEQCNFSYDYFMQHRS